MASVHICFHFLIFFSGDITPDTFVGGGSAGVDETAVVTILPSEPMETELTDSNLQSTPPSNT